MILAFPEVCDTLTRTLGNALGSSKVLDGPPAQFVGTSGLAIGTTREDVSSDFTATPSALSGGIAEGLTITCLAWSGGGGVVFKPFRDDVRTIVTSSAAVLEADPTLGGAVDTCDVTGGTWMQEQTGEGALVSCEFRIIVRRF